MMISIFGLILIPAVVIGMGMGAFGLLSLVINALTGRGTSNPPEKVGAWSGLKSAVSISAGLVAILLVVGGLSLVGVRRSTQKAMAYEQAIVIRTTLHDEETTT
jgi:hypothetical protein